MSLTIGANLPGTPNIVAVPLTGAASHAAAGGVVGWQNPLDVAILITRVLLDVITPATDGICTLDIGTTATDATTTSDNLIDGKDVGAAAGLFDNLTDGGTNGKARQKLAAGKWVTIDEKTNNATGLVATLYIHFVPLISPA